MKEFKYLGTGYNEVSSEISSYANYHDCSNTISQGFGSAYSNNNSDWGNNFAVVQEEPEKSIFTANNSICYPESKKRSCEMSFVGIYAIDNGLLAFGDSKSSTESVLGGFVQDGPPNRIKVFKHDDFLMVTYGHNQIFDSKKNRNIVPIENVIPSIMNDVTSYREFLLAFQDYLWFVQSPHVYQFAFGIKEHGIYKVVAYNVSQKVVELVTNGNDGIFCYGVPFYTSKARDIREQFRKRTVEEAAEKIADIINGLVKEADEKFDTYNPVGGEIRIEILK